MFRLSYPQSGLMPATIRFLIRTCKRRGRNPLASASSDPVQEGVVKSLKTSAVRRTAIAVTTFILCGAFAIAQEATSIASNPDPDTMTPVRNFQEQVPHLRPLLHQIR